MGNVGNRVRLTIDRPPQELIERFRDAAPPDLADAMSKSGAMRGIQPMYTPIQRCIGPAITVNAPTGDSLMIRKAMTIAQPGDIIVIDGGGAINPGLWGGNRSAMVAARGIAGVIIDGAARDIGESQELGLPLFARAVCPLASAAVGAGELNFPISCGGMVVNPGDIVVADAEGIVVIPKDDAEDVYAAWQKILGREAEWREKSAAGKEFGGDDVNDLLQAIGTEILE